MKYGLHLAGGASVCDRKVLMDVARIAEEEGCDSLLIGDHIVLPKTIASPWPYEEYNDGKPNYDIYTSMEWLDPFDTIAFVAGITEKMWRGGSQPSTSCPAGASFSAPESAGSKKSSICWAFPFSAAANARGNISR